MTYWLLRIKWKGWAQHLTLAFTYPPTRQDVLPLLERQWRADKRADDSWEFLLIADFIPDFPWGGSIETWYGTITCQERYMHDNGPNES